MLKKSVKLAVEARNSFWDALKVTPDHRYNRALVAASIGSYGAYLADGSEYRYMHLFDTLFSQMIVVMYFVRMSNFDVLVFSAGVMDPVWMLIS